MELARQHSLGIVLENLKHMRRRMKYGRRVNRRIHTIPFRRLQHYIKAHLASLPVVYVDAKHTPSLCPVCGGKLAPNGYRLKKCLNRRYENDGDITACSNLLKRNPRCGEFQLPPKAIHEALKAEMERIVIKC